ncbi:MAG: anthranilate synthase component I family protein [bacterium]|nr:anthranilate synthase component I family protein [bacterium]
MKANPISTFKDLSSKNKNICFLYSGKGGKSILAYNPKAKYSGSSVEKFKSFAKKNKNCILIGYISYDVGYKLHNVKRTAKNDLRLPDIYFLAFDQWQEFDTNQKTSISDSRASGKAHDKNLSNFKPETEKASYNKAYNKIKKYIKEGDIYQINLTHRLKAKSTTPARELFLKVIQHNPVDFLAYIEGPDFEILSASPERFIKIKKNHIETCPIKGTRSRGKTPKEDEKMKKELIENVKEAAELNMITDLLRNDLGKVCKIGSVKVQGHRLLQKCPSVWHTYSKITGDLATDPLEALISMLPGGSITGCPKKRAIEIIDELEPTTRSVYTGVIGYIKPDQTLDFNIAIRTIIKKKENLYLQVGGGIVLDSTNKAEYKETLDKAASFMKILS